MTNFRRQAEINVRLNATQAQRALLNWQNAEKARIRQEIEGLRKLQRVAGRTDKERMKTRKALSRLRKQLLNFDLDNERRVLAEEKKLFAARTKLERGITRALSIEAKRRKVIRVNEVADAKRASRSRAMAGAGRGIFAGVGPHGMSGGIYAGGMMGGAALAGFAAYGGVRSASSKAIEEGKALASVMALVTQHEREAGFNIAYARDRARELAIELGISIPEAATAMREAITTAVDPVSSPDFVRAAQGLAVIEGADIGETTATLAAVRNAYSMTGAEMKTVADIVFTSIDEGRVKMDQIKGQLGDAAGIARAAGISFRELMAGHAALTRGGMSGARAMTSMRAFGEILLKPATKATQNYRDQAGLDLSAERMKAVGFLQVMDEIRAASERTGISIAKLLGGRVRALKGIIQLSGALRDDMEDIMEAQTKNINEGRAEKMRQEYLDTSAQRMERLGSAFSAAATALGEGIIGGFSKGMGDADDFQKKLTLIVDVAEDIGTSIGGVVQGISWLNDNLGFLSKGFWGIYDVIQSTNKALDERNKAQMEADAAALQAFKDAEMERQAVIEAQMAGIERLDEGFDNLAQKRASEAKDQLNSTLDLVKEHYKKRLGELEKYLKEEEAALAAQDERRRQIRDAKQKARGASSLEIAFTKMSDYKDAVKRGDIKAAMGLARDFQGMDVAGLARSSITSSDIEGVAGSTDPMAMHKAYTQLLQFQEKMRAAASSGGKMSAADALGISMMEGAGGEGSLDQQTKNIESNIRTIKEQLADVEAHWAGSVEYVKILDQILTSWQNGEVGRNTILGLLPNVLAEINTMRAGTGIETMADGTEMKYHKGGVKVYQNFFAPVDPAGVGRAVQKVVDRQEANPDSN